MLKSKKLGFAVDFAAVFIFVNFIAVFICAAIVTVVVCATFAWRFLTLPEIIHHVTTPLNGVDHQILWRFCSTLFFFLICFVLPLLEILRRKSIRGIKIYNFVILGLTLSSLIYFFAFRIYGASNIIAGLFTEKSRFIEENYVDPKSVKIEFKEKRNLIHIYIESMETVFANDNSKHLIPNLHNLAKSDGAVDFSGGDESLNGAHYTYGANYTFASFFGQNTGIPLSKTIFNKLNARRDTIATSYRSLGKILDEHSYQMMFLCGSDVKFASTDIFLKEHGNYTVYDYNWFVGEGLEHVANKKFWGAEDEKVFSVAKSILLDVAKKNTPFTLLIFTIDTHYDGFLSKSCQTEKLPFDLLKFNPLTFSYKEYYKYRQGGESEQEFKDRFYSQILRCADKQIIDFVNWVKRQDFYENTTIVLTGDHPFMGNFNKDVDIKERKTYFAILNPYQKFYMNTKGREFNLFDSFPTILAALGATIEGERLGLGTNLFSGKSTLIEKYGNNYIQRELQKRTDFFDKIMNQ